MQDTNSTSDFQVNILSVFSPPTALAGDFLPCAAAIIMNLLNQGSPILLIIRFAINDDIDIHRLTPFPLVFPPLRVCVQALFERGSGFRGGLMFRHPEECLRSRPETRRGRRAFEWEGKEGMSWGRADDGASDGVGGMFEDICDRHRSREVGVTCGRGSFR